MQTAKQKLKRAAPWLFLLLVLAGLAAVRGLAANYEIGYEIMNGDFQNYNPVRHLLAGQVPYRDFTVYLGAGELYSVGGLLLVLGNSFGRSMFATNFCTWFYLSCWCWRSAWWSSALPVRPARQRWRCAACFLPMCRGQTCRLPVR